MHDGSESYSMSTRLQLIKLFDATLQMPNVPVAKQPRQSPSSNQKFSQSNQPVLRETPCCCSLNRDVTGLYPLQQSQSWTRINKKRPNVRTCNVTLDTMRALSDVNASRNRQVPANAKCQKCFRNTLTYTICITYHTRQISLGQYTSVGTERR